MTRAHMRNACGTHMRTHHADAYATYVRTYKTDAEPLTRDSSVTLINAHVRIRPGAVA